MQRAGAVADIPGVPLDDALAEDRLLTVVKDDRRAVAAARLLIDDHEVARPDAADLGGLLRRLDDDEVGVDAGRDVIGIGRYGAIAGSILEFHRSGPSSWTWLVDPHRRSAEGVRDPSRRTS